MGPFFLALTEASSATPPAHWQRQSALQASAPPLQQAPAAREQQRLLYAAAAGLLEQGLGEPKGAAWRAAAVPAALRLPAGQGGGQG